MWEEESLWHVDGEDLCGLPYEELYLRFRWRLPPVFNIGVATCDRHAERTPDAPAIFFDLGDGTSQTWTFSDLRGASNRLAVVLQGLGVTRGDRVAILLSQCPQLAVAHIAAYKLGAIAVPLFTLFGTDALAYRLNDSGAVVLITDAENAERVQDLRSDLPELRHVIVIDRRMPGTLHWDDVLGQAHTDDFQTAATTPDDPAILIYTSGTTGPAKGALHGHRILIGHLPGVSMPHEFAPQPGDLFWTPADWAWIGGLYDVLFPALYWGIPVVAHRMRKFDPELAFRLMERWQVRNVFVPPTSLKMMREVLRPRHRWQLQLRTLASGGEPLGEETLAWSRAELGLPINEFYGQTECNLVVSNCSSLFAPRPGSMGRPVPGHQVAVIDEDGRVLPPGEVGEIAVRRPDPVMFLGYWGRPDATAAKFAGDWLRTGDLGRADADGFLWFVGRADDVITSAGYRIGPAEIEEASVKHPAVLMAAAVGTPDPVRGEVVKLFVRLREGIAPSHALASELQDWVRDRVGRHEYPREVEFTDEFPMTPSGKIQRHILRRREYERKGVPWPGR